MRMCIETTYTGLGLYISNPALNIGVSFVRTPRNKI